MTENKGQASWEKTAAAKRAIRDSLIPKEWRIKETDALNVIDVPKTCGVLSAKEIKITETPGAQLVKKMTGGELTSYEVVLTFCKAAAIAQQLTNCLTEIFFEEALARAKAIDEQFAKDKKPLGPFHGLPVSLKDMFNVEGYDTTIGFVGWSNDPRKKEDESAPTLMLRELGAVLFCKTNVSTAMMIGESTNNVWGYTTNPYNRSHSAGGSSGGETALMALLGAPIGVGSDIGGSIRIPSSFCGMYGLKPSFGRLATYASRSGLPGQEAIKSTNGPIAPDLETIELYTKSFVELEWWNKDPNVVSIPWRQITVPQQLCFGIILDNGMVKPFPPIQRALQTVREALEKAGHKVIEFHPYKAEVTDGLLPRLFQSDGAYHINKFQEISGEPFVPGLAPYETAYKSSKDTPYLGHQLWQAQSERTTYIKGCLDTWQATKSETGTGRPIDGVISPIWPGPAPKIGEFEFVAYTGMWNLNDQPTMAFPVGRVDPEKDVDDSYVGRSDLEKRMWKNYDAKSSAGLPTCLQLVVPRLQEELLVELAKVIDHALR